VQIKSPKFEIRIQSQEFKCSFKFYLVWTDCLSQQFLEIIRVELDLAPKREFVLHDLFYRCANLKKIMEVSKYLFSVDRLPRSTNVGKLLQSN
jgi:hypothetical protein